MKRWSWGQFSLTVGLSALVWAVLAVGCLLVGSTGSFGLPTHDGAIAWGVLRIRLDTVLAASLIGAGLGAAGVVYQAILRNPLADPYLLGVASGASLFAYLWSLPAMGAVLLIPLLGQTAIGQQLFAFIGAILAVAIVLALASRRGRLEPITLLLVGVIVNAIAGAIFLLINELVKDPARTGGAIAFLVGGMPSAVTAGQFATVGAVVGIGWLAMAYIAGSLNAAVLSESEASALGVRINRLRWFGMVVASLVTASVVALSGPIGFIGLICPHIARLFVGHDQRRLLPLATALGAGLLAVADAASRRLAQEFDTTLAVGVLTNLLGGPFFLFLLWRQRR